MDASEIRRGWAERSGEYSPDYYAYHGPNDTSEQLRELFDAHLDRDAAILELGCSAGRHLAHLHDHGFSDVSGIEINKTAFRVLAQAYPVLDATGSFYRGAIESVLPEFRDGQFAAVYSVETLQHLHPDSAWVYDELARITDDVLVTVENEGGDDHRRAEGGVPVNYVNGDFPLYYRDWNRIFTNRGFVAIESRPVADDTLRVFRRAPE